MLACTSDKIFIFDGVPLWLFELSNENSLLVTRYMGGYQRHLKPPTDRRDWSEYQWKAYKENVLKDANAF